MIVNISFLFWLISVSPSCGVTLHSFALVWDIDIYSIAEAALFDISEYEAGEDAVALGKMGASPDEAADGFEEWITNAQVSTTCLPCVFMILIVWPARTKVAAPRRAGTR